MGGATVGWRKLQENARATPQEQESGNMHRPCPNGQNVWFISRRAKFTYIYYASFLVKGMCGAGTLPAGFRLARHAWI